MELLFALFSILYVCAGILASFAVFARIGWALASLANFPDVIFAMIIAAILIGVLVTSRVIINTRPAARARAILEKIRDELHDYDCDW